MHHHVEGERQAGRAHRGGELQSCARTRRPRPAMRSALAGSWSWKLSCTWRRPGLGERRDLALAAQRAGGDEVAVEAVRRRLGDQRAELAPHHRLAAGEMDLQHAERRRLAQHAPPLLAAQLGRCALELDRVGAIGAGAADSDASARRAGPGAGQAAGIGQASLVREILQHRGDVAGDLLARRVELCAASASTMRRRSPCRRPAAGSRPPARRAASAARAPS